MGSNTSKADQSEPAVRLWKDSESCDSNDPRSPTPEIVRTPLHGKSSNKHNITKNMDLRKTFENANGDEKLIHNNPILSAVIRNHLQSYDPRSPTQDFERTPIVITTKDEVEELRILNNNCGSPCLKDDCEQYNNSITENANPDMVPKNLCNGFFDMTLNESIKDEEEPLGSSTASNEAIEKNVSTTKEDKPPTQLLETNFDYVENETDTFEDSEENVQDLHEYEALDQEIKYIPTFKILPDDPRSPSIGIERTPIVVARPETKDSNVEEMSDDLLIKTLQTTNAELRQTASKPSNDILNADDLLIYEDDDADSKDSVKTSKSITDNGSRTPLSCMKNKSDVGHARSKSANTLFDPKGTQVKVISKIPRRVSYIPRLKSLSKQTKLLPAGSSVSLKNLSKTSGFGGDCENTPPHSHRDRWDKDNSIVL